MKHNKTSRIQKHQKEIQKEFFDGKSIKHIAEKFGYEYKFLTKYLEGRATKHHTDSNGIQHTKCSVCTVYRTRDHYCKNGIRKNGDQMYTASCKECTYRMKKNRYIIKKNTGDTEDYKRRFRKHWNKFSWKYNFRKRYMRIIGYLDSNGRRINT